MKKTMFLFVTTILVVSSALIGCKKNEVAGKVDQSLETIKQKGEFVLGLDDSFPPMGFRDENGNIVGFDIDLAKEVAKRMGVTVELRPVDWDGVILSLKNKDIDMIWNGLTITPARQEQILFSDVYLNNRQVLIVLNDSPIKTKENLSGMVLGLQMGSSSEAALNSHPSIANSLKEVKKYSNNVEALMDLAAKRVDAVLIDEVVGRYYIEKKPEVYVVLEDDFGGETYGIGFRKEDVSFAGEINRLLKEMKEDGTAAAISQKWFSADIMGQ